MLLLEPAPEKDSDQHLDAYRPEGGNSGNHGLGHQGPRRGQGTTPKNARYMVNVQDIFWCDARDEQGGLVHAVDCDPHECFVVQGNKQETNTSGRAKMPDHYRCTITCTFCGKRRHYEDECYHKQRLSAKLKSEALNGGGGAGGKYNGEKGKGESQGRGKGDGKAQGKCAGRGFPDKKNQDKNKDRNKDRSGGKPNPTPGGTNPEPPGGQQSTGPTTVPRGQHNKKKELSVPTKVGTSLPPEQVPALCGWRENCARRRLTLPVSLSSDRDALEDLQTWCSGYVSVLGDENTGVLDTGATISIVAKKNLPHQEPKNTMPTAIIRMGDGHVVHNCGDCEVNVPMGSRSIAHRFYAMDSEAFDFVLGTDFFVENSGILSLTLQAPYVLQADDGERGESVPLEQSEHRSSYLRMCKKEASAMMLPPK